MVETKDGKKIEQDKPSVAETPEVIPEPSQEGLESGIEAVDLDQAEAKLDIAALEGEEQPKKPDQYPKQSQKQEVQFPPATTAVDQTTLTGGAEAEARGLRADNMSNKVTDKPGTPLAKYKQVVRGMKSGDPSQAEKLHNDAEGENETATVV